MSVHVTISCGHWQMWGSDQRLEKGLMQEPLEAVFWEICLCSVAKSCLSLWPHGLQHARLPCLSLSPGVCSNSCPLSQWHHATISSSVASFSSCPQSFPVLTKQDVPCESCELSFIGGKMRTAAWEIAPQLVLRDCSKEVVGKGQYIRFWWRGNSMPSSAYFTRDSLLVVRIWCHHEGI